jgi:nucleoside-diphosphate-sugar epimerase
MTGEAGFLGRHLVWGLLGDGFAVAAVVRLDNPRPLDVQNLNIHEMNAQRDHQGRRDYRLSVKRENEIVFGVLNAVDEHSGVTQPSLA